MKLSFSQKLPLALFATLTALSACNSGSSSNGGTAGQISGVVTAPNGDPISLATVWIPESSSSLSALKIKRGPNKLTDGDLTCEDTPETATDSACTAADGSFTLTCTGTGSTTVKFSKGSFSGTTTIDCGTNSEDAFAFPTDPSAGAPNIAVVTGTYDRIEDVLAKLGFGTVDETGLLDQDLDFNFTLIDGNNSLADGTYTNFDDFVSSADNLDDFDIIFINCGNVHENVLADSATIARLQDYVDDGGKLYVTDQAYDFIEQPFFGFMDFLEGGADAATAETLDAAQAGTGGSTVNATVNDELSDWLENVSVNTGNPDDNCGDTTVNGQVGALNDDGTVTIADFLSAWAVMVEPHDTDTTTWVSGDVAYFGGSADDAPLTVTLDQGSGRLLFSSYHTAHSCPTTGFWPQERVLQYLVFEL